MFVQRLQSGYDGFQSGPRYPVFFGQFGLLFDERIPAAAQRFIFLFEFAADADQIIHSLLKLAQTFVDLVVVTHDKITICAWETAVNAFNGCQLPLKYRSMRDPRHIDYDQLQAALSLAGLDLSAAEVHGVLCGSMCNQMKTGASPDLQKLLLAGSKVPAESLRPLQGHLENLLHESVQSLYGDDSELNLLLPDDDESISLRLQALADWCRGYAIGLLNEDSLAIDQLSAEAAEMVRDFMTITEVDAARVGEGDEWDMAEVEEYVRMGVQFIFEELNQAQQSGSTGKLH